VTDTVTYLVIITAKYDRNIAAVQFKIKLSDFFSTSLNSSLIIFTECAKKMTQLVLSELRQISTKFDNFWHTDSQSNRKMKGTLIVHLT